MPKAEFVHELDSHGNVTNVIVDGRHLTPGERDRHLSGFGGIGTVITTNEQGIIVQRVLDKTPAQSAGVLAGDMILSVDGTSLRGLSLSDAVKALRGLPGSIAHLIILRSGQTSQIPFSVVREIIRVPNALITNAAWSADRMVLLNFSDSPLNQVLGFYADITGTTVTVEKASYPAITLQPGKRLSVGDALRLLETSLASNGVTLTRSSQGVSVTPDSGRMPVNGDMIRIDERQVITPSSHLPSGAGPDSGALEAEKAPKQFTDEELRHHFIEYRRKLKEAGLPQPSLTTKEVELGIKEE